MWFHCKSWLSLWKYLFPKTHPGEAHDDKFYQLILQRHKKILEIYYVLSLSVAQYFSATLHNTAQYFCVFEQYLFEHTDTTYVVTCSVTIKPLLIFSAFVLLYFQTCTFIFSIS